MVNSTYIGIIVDGHPTIMKGLLSDGYMGVSIVMGLPNSWRVFVRQNPNLKWIITRATPMT